MYRLPGQLSLRAVIQTLTADLGSFSLLVEICETITTFMI